MNKHGYRCTDENGLSFERLVDGEPLGQLVGARDTAIPYWIIEDDLPYYPPHWETHDPEIRIVAVCSCGEYGCGHTQCRVIRSEASVILREFDMDCTAEGRQRQFEIARDSYDFVVSQIVAKAREQRDRDAAKR
jgi:hypothetical protein